MLLSGPRAPLGLSGSQRRLTLTLKGLCSQVAYRAGPADRPPGRTSGKTDPGAGTQGVSERREASRAEGRAWALFPERDLSLSLHPGCNGVSSGARFTLSVKGANNVYPIGLC